MNSDQIFAIAEKLRILEQADLSPTFRDVVEAFGDELVSDMQRTNRRWHQLLKKASREK